MTDLNKDQKPTLSLKDAMTAYAPTAARFRTTLDAIHPAEATTKAKLTAKEAAIEAREIADHQLSCVKDFFRVMRDMDEAHRSQRQVESEGKRMLWDAACADDENLAIAAARQIRAARAAQADFVARAKQKQDEICALIGVANDFNVEFPNGGEIWQIANERRNEAVKAAGIAKAEWQTAVTAEQDATTAFHAAHAEEAAADEQLLAAAMRRLDELDGVAA